MKNNVGHVSGFDNLFTGVNTSTHQNPIDPININDIKAAIRTLKTRIATTDISTIFDTLNTHIENTNNPHEDNINDVYQSVLKEVHKVYLENGGNGSLDKFIGLLFRIIEHATTSDLNNGTSITKYTTVADAIYMFNKHFDSTSTHSNIIDSVFTGEYYKTIPTIVVSTDIGMDNYTYIGDIIGSGISADGKYHGLAADILNTTYIFGELTSEEFCGDTEVLSVDNFGYSNHIDNGDVNYSTIESSVNEEVESVWSGNYFFDNEDFYDLNTWRVSGNVIIDEVTGFIDGQKAFKLIETVDDSSNSVVQDNIPIGTFEYGCYIEKGDKKYIALSAWNNTDGTIARATIDAELGTIFYQEGTVTITSVVDGYLVTISGTCTENTSIYCSLCDDTGSSSYIGDGVSGSWFAPTYVKYKKRAIPTHRKDIYNNNIISLIPSNVNSLHGIEVEQELTDGNTYTQQFLLKENNGYDLVDITFGNILVVTFDLINLEFTYKENSTKTSYLIMGLMVQISVTYTIQDIASTPNIKLHYYKSSGSKTFIGDETTPAIYFSTPLTHRGNSSRSMINVDNSIITKTNNSCIKTFTPDVNLVENTFHIDLYTSSIIPGKIITFYDEADDTKDIITLEFGTSSVTVTIINTNDTSYTVNDLYEIDNYKKIRISFGITDNRIYMKVNDNDTVSVPCSMSVDSVNTFKLGCESTDKVSFYFQKFTVYNQSFSESFSEFLNLNV